MLAQPRVQLYETIYFVFPENYFQRKGKESQRKYFKFIIIQLSSNKKMKLIKLIRLNIIIFNGLNIL